MDRISIRTIFHTGSLLALTLLTGCASAGKSKPSCPVPDGVRCMSTLDVYEATNSSDRIEAPAEGKNVPTSNDALLAYGADRPQGTRIDGDTLALSNAPRAIPASYTNYSNEYRMVRPGEPYREPARVIRIYVSAWEDEQGDLHMPGYIFSELEARRWSVGEKAIDSDDTFRLLGGPGEQAAKDSRAAADATADAGRPVRIGKPN